MASVPVRWWAEGGFIVEPAPTPVHVVGVRGQSDRATARRTIRTALVVALAQATGLPTERIVLCGAPGEAPYALLDGSRRLSLSISHDGDLSVAALRLDGGAVGIDVMQVNDVPDWQVVAHDYLGPACAVALARLPAPARAAAFARAWSEHEARLKSRGLGLEEWTDGLAAAVNACPCWPLAVPQAYAGSVALV